MFALLWVKIRGVVIGKFGGKLLKFGYWNFSFDQGAGVLKCCGEEHGYGSVKEGDAASYLAGEWMKV